MVFDDTNAVANGGLCLPLILADHLGLRELIDESVDLGGVAGHANVGLKAIGLIASILAGGDSIADADVLRSGRSEVAIGQWMPAPSTLGTYLRGFTWAHTRSLDSVAAELLARAWNAGGGPGKAPLTIDVDSTNVITHNDTEGNGYLFPDTTTNPSHQAGSIGGGIRIVDIVSLPDGSQNGATVTRDHVVANRIVNNYGGGIYVTTQTNQFFHNVATSNDPPSRRSFRDLKDHSQFVGHPFGPPCRDNIWSGNTWGFFKVYPTTGRGSFNPACVANDGHGPVPGA